MKKVYYTLLSILLFTSCEKGISEFQSQNFIKFFGSGNESKGNCVIIADSDESSYLLVGSNKSDRGGKNGIYAVKVDKFGNTIFEITYPNNDSIQEGTIVKKIDDGFIIIGTSQVNSSDYINPILLKINSYGDIVWKKVINKTYKLIINDFCVEGEKIFLAGESYETYSNTPENYVAYIYTSGNNFWDKDPTSKGYYKKINIKPNGKIILFGVSSGSENTIQIYETDQNSPNPFPLFNKITPNLQLVRDAFFSNESSFVLINGQNITPSDTLKILKINSDYSIAWESQPIFNFEGKCMTYWNDESFYICGNYNNEIVFAQVDQDGNAYDNFKKYPGTAGSIINTPDNGLLIVGTTSNTYGTMVQLIKTDKDLYLLKP